MNLYLQVLSQVQTAEIVRMLLLPDELQSGQSGCQLKVSTGGKIRTRNFRSVNEAVADIQDVKFNQLEISYSISTDKGFRMPGNPASVVGLFTVSPTCELWFKAADWPSGGERAVRMRKMNAKAAETALTYYKVSQKPSVFEVVVEIDTSEPPRSVLDACAGWLAKFVPNIFDSLAVFGCVDAGGPEFFVKLESNVLMTEDIRILAKLLPSAYPELGQKFDAIHPVMFGHKKVCEGIALALGGAARVIPNEGMSDFAVVRVNAECESRDARNRVSRWILPSAESAPIPGKSP